MHLEKSLLSIGKNEDAKNPDVVEANLSNYARKKL